MTRQQKRFQARQEGKGALVTKAGPFFYGAFYKDDKADGFAFTVDAKKGPQNAMLINMLIETSEKMVKDFYMLPKEQQDSQILDQKTILNYSMKAFNTIVFPEGRKGFINNIPDDAVEPGLTAASSIHFLTSIGEITNDEYNGMHFMYDDLTVKTSV